MACWLLKTESTSFSIDDLRRSPKATTCWDGVRNYQARNFMRQMKRGERVLFYHSGGDLPAVAGTAVVVRAAYPDSTAWDSNSDHPDPRSTPDAPVWDMVDIRLDAVFAEPITLTKLRKVSGLSNMELLRKGSRLSVQPVRDEEFAMMLKLADGQANDRPTARAKSKPTKKKTAAPASRGAKPSTRPKKPAGRKSRRV